MVFCPDQTENSKTQFGQNRRQLSWICQTDRQFSRICQTHRSTDVGIPIRKVTRCKAMRTRLGSGNDCSLTLACLTEVPQQSAVALSGLAIAVRKGPKWPRSSERSCDMLATCVSSRTRAVLSKSCGCLLFRFVYRETALVTCSPRPRGPKPETRRTPHHLLATYLKTATDLLPDGE